MVRPLALALLLILFAPTARASTPDVFGLGSEASALAGAVTARTTDFAAAFYNPAGLALGGPTGEVSLGWTGYASRLSVRGQRVSISDPTGFDLGLRMPVPLEGALAGRIALGLALHLLPDQVLHVVAHAPEEAFFPYYDNRTQRLVVLPAVGVKLTERLAFGVGFNFLAGLRGKVDSSPGATRTIEPRIDQKIEATARVHAGLRFALTPELALALAYRQSFSVPFRIDTANKVAGQDIDIAIDAEGLFTPHQVWLGAAFSPDPRLSLSMDVGWLHWSGWRGPYVTVLSVLPLAGALDVDPPALGYQDIVSLRAGAEWRAADRPSYGLRLRAGGGFEPSPMPDQPGVTNLIDGHKIIAAAGVGLLLKRLLPQPQPIRIDAHLMAHLLTDRTYTKVVYASTDPSCPGANPVCGLHDEVRDNTADPTTLGTQISNLGYPAITGGGSVWEAGLTVTLPL